MNCVTKRCCLLQQWNRFLSPPNICCYCSLYYKHSLTYCLNSNRINLPLSHNARMLTNSPNKVRLLKDTNHLIDHEQKFIFYFKVFSIKLPRWPTVAKKVIQVPPATLSLIFEINDDPAKLDVMPIIEFNMPMVKKMA